MAYQWYTYVLYMCTYVRTYTQWYMCTYKYKNYLKNDLKYKHSAG
jgi:hypothetical protein